MNKFWHFYDPRTGALAGRTYSGPEHALAANTPAGLSPIEGDLDHLSQRVDVDAGKVVDWQPPQPDADHTWDKVRRRWVLTAAAQAREVRRMTARARLEKAEASQARAIREHLLGQPGAIDRLAAIESEIVAARAALT